MIGCWRVKVGCFGWLGFESRTIRAQEEVGCVQPCWLGVVEELKGGGADFRWRPAILESGSSDGWTFFALTRLSVRDSAVGEGATLTNVGKKCERKTEKLPDNLFSLMPRDDVI
eukprot:614467-Rhodomonas_salina.1